MVENQKQTIPTIYWQKGKAMIKFHAFTLDSGFSLCGEWFMGGAASADDIDILPLKKQEKAKCVHCNKKIRK
jgi:hypothetical protein